MLTFLILRTRDLRRGGHRKPRPPASRTAEPCSPRAEHQRVPVSERGGGEWTSLGRGGGHGPDTPRAGPPLSTPGPMPVLKPFAAFLVLRRLAQRDHGHLKPASRSSLEKTMKLCLRSRLGSSVQLPDQADPGQTGLTTCLGHNVSLACKTHSKWFTCSRLFWALTHSVSHLSVTFSMSLSDIFFVRVCVLLC